MKYCEKYVPALSALMDGELNDTEREKVLAHLETCESCREFFAELTAMHDAMGELEEYDAPEGFADGVMARLHEAPAPKKRTPRTSWVSLAACAAIMLLAVGGPLRSQFGAKSTADSAAPEAAMLTMAESEECAEEEYTDNYASVQNAPMTMMATSGVAPPTEGGIGQMESELPANDVQLPRKVEDLGEADPGEDAVSANDADANDAYSNDANSNESNADNASFANDTPTQLPRSVVFVYGAVREDYLIESATSFDYDADGTIAGYDLPVEQFDEFLALLDADGVAYDSSIAKQATTFYVQYEEAGANE